MYKLVDPGSVTGVTVTGGATQSRRGRLRPHWMPLVVGLLDARVCRVDYFDTVAGPELGRLYRLARAGRGSG